MNRRIKYLFKIKTSHNNLHLLNQDLSFTCHFYDRRIWSKGCSNTENEVLATLDLPLTACIKTGLIDHFSTFTKIFNQIPINTPN